MKRHEEALKALPLLCQTRQRQVGEYDRLGQHRDAQKAEERLRNLQETMVHLEEEQKADKT